MSNEKAFLYSVFRNYFQNDCAYLKGYFSFFFCATLLATISVNKIIFKNQKVCRYILDIISDYLIIIKFFTKNRPERNIKQSII
jgi:hypothetical protein